MVLATLLQKKARPACPRQEGNCNTYCPGSFCGAFKTGKLQFEDFVRDRLVERTKPTDNHIQRNKLKSFGQPTQEKQEGKKAKS